MAIWKDVRGYEGIYAVSDDGQIKSLERMKPHRLGDRVQRERIMKPHIINGGYVQVGFCREGHLEGRLVHRVVAEAFIPNPNNLLQVNHKDGNKLNNHVSNLEWCTAKDNVVHSINCGLRKSVKAIDVFTRNGEYIATYPSAAEAARHTGLNRSGIWWRCKNGLPCRKYIFRYSEEAEHG